MQLIYINQTFLKVKDSVKDKSPSLKAVSALSKALFYDEQKNSWYNPYPLTERTTLDYVKTKNEFNERKWILLKKNKNPDLNEKYAQEGPYSALEIFEMVRKSELRLDDPIWKEGLPKWTAIKKTQTFKELETLSKPLEADVADLLGSVVEYDPEMHRVEKKNQSPGNPDEVFIIFDEK